MQAPCHGTSQAAVLALLWLGLTGGLPRPVVAAPSESLPAVQSVKLEYQETDFAFLFVGSSCTPQSQPFKSEPAFAGRPVLRGHLQFGPNFTNRFAFAWDYQPGKLHLDLNRNGNLTDDPDGTFAAPVLSQQSQTFTNVHLSFPTTSGAQRCAVDLNFYRFGSVGAAAHLRSWWQGQISLQGRSWQVGLIGNPTGDPRRPEGDSLLLRPWAARQEPFSLQDGSLSGFQFSRHLFFNGRAYEVQSSRDAAAGTVKLQFKEQQPRLGELKINGALIDRLVLRGNDYTVVLDRPGPVASVPAGDYTQCLVQLEQGAVSAVYEAGFGGSPKVIAVSAGQSASLLAGGPLTNSVTFRRHGRVLNLEYQLVGVGGGQYRLLNLDRSKPPRFAVHQGGKEIFAGKFEFG